jgi:hypothetical protein
VFALLCRYESSETQVMMKKKDTDMCRLDGAAAADVAVNSGDGRFEMDMDKAMRFPLFEQLLPRETVQHSWVKQPRHAQVCVSCTLSSTMRMWACMVACVDASLRVQSFERRKLSCVPTFGTDEAACSCECGARERHGRAVSRWPCRVLGRIWA